MKFISVQKNATNYVFTGENGEKVVTPKVTTVLVDDNSGIVTVKDTASRSTIGYYIK